MCVTFAPGQKGYVDINHVDINNVGIAKLSDADFPAFMNWRTISEGNTPFSNDGLCDIDQLKTMLGDVHGSPIRADAELKELAAKNREVSRYVNDPDHAHIREQLRGFVCEAPSEWSVSNVETRYLKLLEAGECFEGKKPAYDRFIAFAKQFCFWDTTGLPEGKLWFFHPLQFIRHFRRCGWLTGTELRHMFPPNALRRVSKFSFVSERVTPNSDTIASFGPGLNKAMRKFGVTTPLRQAAFLGNAMQETQWFRLLAEDSPDNQRYFPWFGRGFLQLTWPDNYVRYWRFRGRQVDDALANRLHDAARTANQTGNNAALAVAEAHVPEGMRDWRESVATQFDASDSAGAYWAWSGAARFADRSPVMRRETKPVGNTLKLYYSCESFGRVAATVNVGHASNSFSSINGLQARYQAYTSALVELIDLMKFPAADGTSQDNPDW
jgi:predicted chitinase